uniref:PGG domain-containing protein n=1 Tax=Brassica campestris TaxID=3711 RepID=M4ENH4_BRACM
MIFRIIILVFIALGSHGRVCSSHQPPTNQSNPNPSFPVNEMGSELLGHSTPPSQSNQTSSSPAYPTQPEHPLNPILPFMVRVPPPPSHLTQQEQNTHSPMHSTLPGQNYLNPQFPMRVPPFPAHPPPPGWSNNQSHSPQSPSPPPPLDDTISILVYQRASQSSDPPSQRNQTVPFPMIQQFFHWSDPPSQNNLTLPFTMFQQFFHWSDLLSQRNLTLPCPMIQQRFQWSDPPSQSIQTLLFQMFQLFFQSAAHSLPPTSPSIRISASPGPLPREFHAMDRLSLCVLTYFLAVGPSYTSTWSQRPNLSTSIHIQCFLNQAAFSLFLLANAVFPRTRPVLAFVLDRLSVFLIVISAYLANMPMFPPHFAIIMFLVVAIVYIFARFRSNTGR